MKAKKVSLTDKQLITLRVLISMEIKSNKEAEKMGVEPEFNTEMLKALYKELAGFEWEKN